MLTPESIPHEHVIIHSPQFLELVILNQLLLLLIVLLPLQILHLFLLFLLLVLSQEKEHLIKAFHIHLLIKFDVFGQSVAQ